MSTITIPPRHAAVVAAAYNEFGTTEHPPGSNTGPRVKWYQGFTNLGGTGWPWCVAFCLAMLATGGKFRYPNPLAGAWALLADARKRGWALDPADWRKAIPGDIVIWNVGSGHASILVSIADGQVTTYDGNASDQVKCCTRPLGLVRGFVSWPEDGHQHATARAPFVQVVGGESGRRKAVVAGKAVPLPRTKDKVT